MLRCYAKVRYSCIEALHVRRLDNFNTEPLTIKPQQFGLTQVFANDSTVDNETVDDFSNVSMEFV